MLKKICRCGKVIPYNLKVCDECKNKQKEDKTNKNRYYDNNYRDKEGIKFYNSKEWNRVKEIVKAKDKGLCRLCLIKNEINYYNIVHHIEERAERKDLALDINNLICLCSSCHNTVHSQYKNNKKEMQNILRNAKG